MTQKLSVFDPARGLRNHEEVMAGLLHLVDLIQSARDAFEKEAPARASEPDFTRWAAERTGMIRFANDQFKIWLESMGWSWPDLSNMLQELSGPK